MQSISEPNAITGFPEPHLAVHAVGIPATPRSTVKPSCSSVSVRYFDVSNSWNPSSPKLKISSLIIWLRVFSASTLPIRSAFIPSTFAASGEAANSVEPIRTAEQDTRLIKRINSPCLIKREEREGSGSERVQTGRDRQDPIFSL